MMVLVADYVLYVQCSVNNAAVYCACVMGRTDLKKRATVFFVCLHPLEETTELKML
jgi:hypothetical protein